MVSSSTLGTDHADTFDKWGVASGPALWPVVLRILFVIDGRINTSKCSDAFGLGYVLETLRDSSFAWWVRFTVEVVRRDQGPLMFPSDCVSTFHPDSNYTEPGKNPKFGFRFTDPSFNLNDWDQVWFFGDYPANQDGDVNEPQFCPLEDAELKLLAEWMDRGGGVFAAGDHWNLGASMCSRIPRVRTMRRWTPEQGVPPIDGNRRHQTLQPSAGYEDLWEGDTIPQPIEPVYRLWTTSSLARPPFPHPLLSTPNGVIDTFPDHMHEGDVVDDNLVELNRAVNIPGYDRPEYPSVEPEINPGTAARVIPGIELPQLRPRPHVVAYGRTTNPTVPEVFALSRGVGGVTSPLSRIRFGLVGAYDGDPVSIGRVVVDSTWHHWFSYNLHGFVAASQPEVLARLTGGIVYQPAQVYKRMQNYYRNIGLWLATPAQRKMMLLAAIWGPVVSDPMAFPPASTRSLWAVGKRAAEVISRTVSQSMLFDFVASFFSRRAEEIFGVPFDVNPADPYAASVPMDLAVRAIVGGIASSLIQPAFEYLQAKGSPRRLANPEAVARHAAKGVKQGQHALIESLRSSAAAAQEIVGLLEEAFQPFSSVPSR